MKTRLTHAILSSIASSVLLVAAGGCEPGGSGPANSSDTEAGDAEDDSASPSDTADTSFQPADINLGLPDTGVGDRELRNGTTVWVGHVVDGDTVVVWVGEFAPVRYTIRMVGLAAPECFKENRSTPDGTGQSCVRDDEIHGLAAFEALKSMVEDKRVKVTCEAAPNALCPKDSFGRSLAYLEIDGKDAGVEMAYGGHALSYVTFYSSKRAEICAGVYDARRRKIGMWALGTETYVISRMNGDTRSWYTALHDKRCDEAMGR